MYLPKSKYTVKITKGGDFYKKDGSTYRGKYIETYNGQIFTGGELTPASEKLEEVTELFQQSDLISGIDFKLNNYWELSLHLYFF